MNIYFDTINIVHFHSEDSREKFVSKRSEINTHLSNNNNTPFIQEIRTLRRTKSFKDPAIGLVTGDVI